MNLLYLINPFISYFDSIDKTYNPLDMKYDTADLQMDYLKYVIIVMSYLYFKCIMNITHDILSTEFCRNVFRFIFCCVFIYLIFFLHHVLISYILKIRCICGNILLNFSLPGLFHHTCSPPVCLNEYVILYKYEKDTDLSCIHS